MPHLIVGGHSLFRKGDRHERRVLHNTFDLIYVQKGILYLEENDVRFTVNEGEFLILVPDCSHGGYRICPEETIFWWVHFFTEGKYSYSDSRTINITNKMNKNKYYRKDPFTISLPQFGKIPENQQEVFLSLLKNISLVKIDRANQQKIFFESVSSNIEYQIWFMKVLSFICNYYVQERKKSLAEEIYEYLALHYQESFEMRTLSEYFSFHPVYLARCTKKKYNLTPLQLLTRIRIEEAKKLLINTKLSINSIGEATGFSNAAYFSKQFKGITGMTPSEYRNRQ